MIIRKIVPGILCILMGCVFIFSGFTKLNPIEPFEYTLVDLGFINWQFAPFIARFMIALEFFIGLLLVFHLHLRKVTYKLSIFTLIIFSAYLLLLISLTGNRGNCGCFGSYFEMTPLQALIKNMVMLAILLALYKYHRGWELDEKWKLIIILPFIAAFAAPFILNPVELNYTEAYLNKPENNFKIPLDSLYNNAELNVPPHELSKGKHILVFLSLTCPHCKIAATKLRIIHERAPEIPIYFVLNGDKRNLKSFFEETHSESIPHCMLSGRNFVYLAGTNLPVIYMINNSLIENEINYFILNEDEIKKWLAKP
jgi:hypothetical protein